MSTTLAEILRRHWPAYVARHGAKNILPSHHAAVGAILSCHTPEGGGSLYDCECGHQHFAYHGCGHRACPQCGHREAQEWLERQTARLLPEKGVSPCLLTSENKSARIPPCREKSGWNMLAGFIM